MEKPLAGEVVVVPFPQTNLIVGKRRPALVLVSLPGDDAILCAITSQPRDDGYSIPLATSDFQTGRFERDSWIRPQRLFTLEKSVILRSVGTLKSSKLHSVLNRVAAIFQPTSR